MCKHRVRWKIDGLIQTHTLAVCGPFLSQGTKFYMRLSNACRCPEEMRKLSVSKSSPWGPLNVFLIDIKSGASYNSISVGGMVRGGRWSNLCVDTSRTGDSVGDRSDAPRRWAAGCRQRRDVCGRQQIQQIFTTYAAPKSFAGDR